MGRELFDGDGEVSQVVGATLLVAVSVVLAVSTGAFVFGLGDGADDTPPEVDFTYEYSQVGNGNLTVVHGGGDALDPARIEVRTDTRFRPAPGNDTGRLHEAAVESHSLDGTAAGGDWVGSSVQSDDEFTLVGDDSTLNNGTIRIVWLDAETDRTSVLGEWRGPAA